ncbi:MAG: hypothetical protein ACOCW3_02240 [Spirochaetota bacterium]
MRNPILEEAAHVYLHRREYLIFHLVSLAGAVLITFALWPNRGFMYFFRTESVPAVFQATVIVHVLAVTGLSLYAGLDRLAEAQIIRYSEWLERTTIPIGILARGKLLAGVVHTLMLTVAFVPLAVVAAGPAGIPIRAVLASEVIVLLAGCTGRVAGMLISHLGETRYVIRVIGGWIFVAVLFVATIQFYQPLNPIYAVIAQHAEDSPLMRANAARSLLEHPLASSGIPLILAFGALAVLYWYSLVHHRRTTQQEREQHA